MRVADDNGSIRVLSKGTTVPDGLDEVRGEFWDIGRMKPDDPQLSGFDLSARSTSTRPAPGPGPAR